MTVNNLLQKKIESLFDELEHLDSGTEEYDRKHRELLNLIDRNVRYDEIVSNRKNDKIKNVISGISIGLPIFAAFLGTIITLRFEERGTITTVAGKRWVDKLLAIKK